MISNANTAVRSALSASGLSACFYRYADRAWVRPAYRRRAMRWRRRLRLAAVVAALVVAALLVRQWSLSRGVVVRPGREVPSDAVFFYQEDAAWSGDAMGASGQTLGKDGDEVVCLASLMAMQHISAPFSGELNPGTLNAWLSANDAYDGQGNLKWDKVAALLGVELVEKQPQGGTSATLDALIQRGIYAVVQVKRTDTGRMHAVLVVGSNHGNYMVVDSLDPMGVLNTLDLYNDRIYAMRYLEANDTGRETI